MLHSPKHDFSAVENFMQFVEVRCAAGVVAPLGFVSVAIPLNKSTPTAEGTLQFAKHIDKRDKIERPVNNRRAAQEKLPIACPNDL